MLGEGKTSICYRCIHKQTHLEYAVKIIKDPHIHDPSDEIELLFCYRQLTHIIHVSKTKKKQFRYIKIYILFRFVMLFIIFQQFIL